MLLGQIARLLRRPLHGALLSLAAIAVARSAHATYSIVVADASTGQTGVAVASCVGGYGLAPLLRVIPGLGAVQVQAHTGFYGQAKLVELLTRGLSPKQALGLITDPAFDPRRALRQYAIVDFWGPAAAFTGEGDGVWAGDRQGQLGALRYSAQGNLLSDGDVLLALESGLRRAEACDLAERLMFALESVASRAGHGDGRCTPRGVSADSGYLRVAGLDGALLVELDVRDTKSVEPVALLRPAYDAFRAQHPCGSLPSQAVACPKPSGGAMSLAPRAASGRGGLYVLGAGGATLLLMARRRAARRAVRACRSRR